MTSLSVRLAAHPIFSCLSQSEIKTLSQNAISHQYRKGEFITQYGDIWPYLFLVSEGAINAIKESGEGRSLIVATINPDEVFWGLAFFQDGLPNPVTLEARDPTRIYLWSRQWIIPVVMQNGHFSWELSCLMVQRMQLASEMVEKLAFQPVAGRLARLLVELYGEDELGPIQRNLTLDEMAARIGSTREMVCRFLHRFADEDLIDITRTEFSIKNWQALDKLANR